MQGLNQPAQLVSDGSSLFVLAAFVAMLMAALVALGYGRHARHVRAEGGSARLALWMLAAASGALGSGVWAAMVLAVSGQSLGYAVGYRPVAAVALWIGAVVLAALALAPAAWKPRPSVVFGCGLVFGVGVALLQIGLVVAIDAEPGVVWDGAGLAFAPLVAAAGGTGALWIVFLGAGRRGKRRREWRWAAAGLVALAVVVAQDLVLTTAALAGQADSLARRGGIPASAAAAVAGLAVPMLLVAGLADLWLRRETRRKPQRSTSREQRGRSADTGGGLRR